MKRDKIIGFIGALLIVPAIAAIVWADTSDVKGPPVVVVKKSGPNCKDDSNCFNRYHPTIKPAVNARPGQLIVFETRDALDSDLNFQSIPDDVTALDLNLVHPMTGPVYIEGAQRGDVLAVTLVDIEPDDYGYTVIVPGFGFLRDKFTNPYIANWRLTRLEATSEQIPAVAIPFNGFMGSVGVLPGDPEIETILGAKLSWQRQGALCSHRNQWALFRLMSVDLRAYSRTDVSGQYRPVRMAETWTSSRCRSELHCSCRFSSTVPAFLSATYITPRATVKCRAPLSRWGQK